MQLSTGICLLFYQQCNDTFRVGLEIKSSLRNKLLMAGVTILVDPKALMHVVGTTMDWYEDDLTAEFVFNNPNAKVPTEIVSLTYIYIYIYIYYLLYIFFYIISCTMHDILRARTAEARAERYWCHAHAC